MLRKIAIATASLIWLTSVAGGLALLWGYSTAPGLAGTPPGRWPEASSLPRRPGEPVLVAVIHPLCPCSRATVGELAVVMARTEGRLAAHVAFVAFPGLEVETDLWRSAATIPGVSVHRDPGGREAALFGAATSGQTMLYGADGSLLFAGGITLARGHHGDNAGLERIVSLVADSSVAHGGTPVFGCALSNGAQNG